MARKGRPTAPVVLTEVERAELLRLARRSRLDRDAALRARIVLSLAAGGNNKQAAARHRVCAHTVALWRRRFNERRLDGLFDEPRPGAPRRIGDERIEEAVRLALEHKPEGATRWSTRMMAAKLA